MVRIRVQVPKWKLILGEGEVIKRSSNDTAFHVIMYLNVGLELALVAIQKCLVLLHDYLGPNTKKLWLHTHSNNRGVCI